MHLNGEAMKEKKGNWRFILKIVLIAIGLIWILAVVISWYALPAWRTEPVGFLALLARVTPGVVVFAGSVISIIKDVKEILEKDKEEKSSKSVIGVKGSVIQYGEGTQIIAGQIQAEKIVGTEHHHHYPSTVARGKSGPLIELLPRATHFTGRDKELEELISQLKPGKVVTLCAVSYTHLTLPTILLV